MLLYDLHDCTFNKIVMENLQYESNNINKPTSTQIIYNNRTFMLAKLSTFPIDNECSLDKMFIWKYFITGHVSESVCKIVSKKPQLLFYFKGVFQD